MKNIRKPAWATDEDFRRATPSRVFHELPPHRRVLHLGGHLGREAQHYNDVVFVEPLPQHAQHLREHGLEVIEAAVCGDRLYVTSYDQGSSVLQPLEHQVTKEIAVQSVTLKDIDNGSFDVLVLDIQGMELAALKSGPLSYNYIIVEASENPRYQGAGTRAEIQTYLEQAGYRLTKRYPHGPHDIVDLVFEKESRHEHGIDR